MNRITPAMHVFDAVPVGGGRGKESPALCWKNQMEKDLAVLDISN